MGGSIRRIALTGADVEFDAERHPDIPAKMMRWRACEAELIQAIGRELGENRATEAPYSWTSSTKRRSATS